MSENDQISMLNERMSNMSKDELRGMVMIAANRIGLILNGNEDYKSNEESIRRLEEGAEIILNAYDNAVMMLQVSKYEN